MQPAQNGGCPQEDVASDRWYVLPVDGSGARAVASPYDAREHWYGARTIAYWCNGEAVLQPWCDDPSGNMRSVGVYIGGEHVADAMSGEIRVLQQIAPKRTDSANGAG